MFNKLGLAFSAMLALGASADERVKCRYGGDIYDTGVAVDAQAKFIQSDADGSTIYTGIFKNFIPNTIYTWELFDTMPTADDAGFGNELFQLKTNRDGQANLQRYVIYEEGEGDLDDIRGKWIGMSCDGSGVVAYC